VTTEPLLTVNRLTTSFHTEKGIVRAVDDVSFAVEKGKILGLVGESGCGKSMTALSIMGLVPTPPGRIESDGIFLHDTNLAALSYREMSRIRGNSISMIFQEPMTSLNPVYTVGRQVGEVVSAHSPDTRKGIRNKVVEMFEMVGIPDPASRYSCYPHQLSGGIRQRVMIAMALICDPELLIADEPTTALDVTIQAQILELMVSLRERLGTSVIMITHDLGVIAEICDDVNVMYAGQIIEKANVFELFDHPSHYYTRGLLKSIPSIAREKQQSRLDSIRGMVPNLLHIPQGCRFHPRCTHAEERCRSQAPELVDIGGGHMVRCWLAQDERQRP